MTQKFALMRPIHLSDPVTITMPAHVWLGFLAAYASTEWNSGAANALATEVRDALLDPVYLKEAEAEAQRQQDRDQRIASELFPGFIPPQVPPDPGELT